jgi:hypothetical protein
MVFLNSINLFSFVAESVYVFCDVETEYLCVSSVIFKLKAVNLKTYQLTMQPYDTGFVYTYYFKSIS